jgi:hypothetical protein
MRQESSCFAFCGMQVLVRGAEDEKRNSADSQMEVLHVIFPFNKLARERKLVCRGLCCLVGMRGWHVCFFFNGEDTRQEQQQGERDEDECGDDDDRPAGRVGCTVRLRPDRATPVNIAIADSEPPINDGGTSRWQSGGKACE